MKKITVLLLILASAFVFTAANKNVKRGDTIPSGVPQENWYPIGEKHGIAVLDYENNVGPHFGGYDYARAIYFVKKDEIWYPVKFEFSRIRKGQVQ